jgi:transcription initiation factor TFIIH subunit 2
LDAQSQLDYEGELTVIIGKDGKDISEDEALDYVLGYAVGNDVSARNFQLPPHSGGQFGYAKSFDGFAPIGPCIVSTSVIPDPHKLSYVTKVNGKIRQETPTSDMIWSIKQIIAHLSRGTTLRKGTAIMTGTPSGVGLFHTDGFLKDGDVVEVSVTKIGTIKNRMVFKK